MRTGTERFDETKRSSASVTFWVVACVGCAALQGFRLGSEPLPHLGPMCSLFCGVSIGSILFPVVCWLPILVARLGRQLRGSPSGSATRTSWRLGRSSDLKWLMAAWLLWSVASLISVLTGGGSGLGFRAVGKIVLVGISFLGLVTWFEESPSQSRSLAVGRGLFLTIVLLACLGLLEMVFPRLGLFEVLRSESSRSIFPRIAGVMTWPNAYGLVLVVGIVIGQGLTETESRRGRGFLFLAQCLLLVQLAASGSRNAWVVFVLASMVVWAFQRSRSRPVLFVALLVLVAALLPVSARQLGFAAPALPKLVQRLPTSALLEEERIEVAELGRSGEGLVGDPRETSIARSLTSRREIWSAAFDALRERPISGIGAGAFESEVGRKVAGRPGLNAHSLPLNLAAETGLLGVLAGLFVVMAFLRPGLQYISRSAAISGGRTLYWWTALGVLVAGQMADCLTYDGVVVAVWCVVAAQVWSGFFSRHNGENLVPGEELASFAQLDCSRES